MGFWSSNQTLQTLNANPERLKVPKTAVLGLFFILASLILNYALERHNPIKLWENSPYPISWADAFYPPICIFLFLTGLFLALRGAFLDRTGGSSGASVALAITATVLYSVFMFGMQFVATGADRLGECPNIDLAANKSNLIPKSKWTTGGNAVGCGVERRGMFLSSYNDVAVFGVIDPAAQQRIVEDLREHYRDARTHPIQVRFFEQQNVNTKYGKNGAVFQSATPVKLVRVANIG